MLFGFSSLRSITELFHNDMVTDPSKCFKFDIKLSLEILIQKLPQRGIIKVPDSKLDVHGLHLINL